MLNIVINYYMYHVCEVPVIFCQRSVKWKLTSGIETFIAKTKSDLTS